MSRWTVARRLLIVWLPFGSLQCGDAPRSGLVLVPAPGESPEAAAEARLAACAADEDPSIPERSDCSSTVHACQQDSDDCVRWSLTRAVVPFLHEFCDFYCGQLQVGIRQGCITRVEGQIGPSVAPDVLDCMRRQLLGSRWDCAPIDGELSVYLGSCTVL